MPEEETKAAGKGPWRYRLAPFVRHYDGARLHKGGGGIITSNTPPDKVGRGYELVEDEPPPAKPPKKTEDTLSGIQRRRASRP